MPGGAGTAGMGVMGSLLQWVTRAVSWAPWLGVTNILQSTSASDLNRDACGSLGSCELLLAPARAGAGGTQVSVTPRRPWR